MMFCSLFQSRKESRTLYSFFFLYPIFSYSFGWLCLAPQEGNHVASDRLCYPWDSSGQNLLCLCDRSVVVDAQPLHVIVVFLLKCKWVVIKANKFLRLHFYFLMP